MSIFSKVFGSPFEWKARRILRETQKEVSKATMPLRDIVTAITKGSYACTQGLKPMFDIDNEKEKTEAEIQVFYEYIYFFMHMTMRDAFSQINEQQIKRMQEYVGSVVSSVAIDSFFAHWPEDLKGKMRDEFYDKLNDAEIEYSSSKEFLSKENPFTGNSLLSILARNVAELSGNSMNPVTMTFVISSTIDAYKEMKLNLLIQKAAEVL